MYVDDPPFVMGPELQFSYLNLVRYPGILFTFSVSQFLFENQQMPWGVLNIRLTSVCFSSLGDVKLSLLYYFFVPSVRFLKNIGSTFVSRRSSHYTNWAKDILSLNKRVNKTLKYKRKCHFSFLFYSDGLMTYEKERGPLIFLQWLS